jgi:Leucine-rich repeat (LRR) protein
VLDLAYKCQINRMTNNTFVHFANTSLTTLILQSCSRHLVVIEPYVFCPLRNLTAVDIAFSLNQVISLKSVLAAFYAFKINGQVVKKFDAKSFTTADPRTVGLCLTENVMQYVLDTCVEELVLSNNYIVAIETHALIRPGSRFNRCLQRLDLSYNAIFIMDHSFLFLSSFFSQLKALEFQEQHIFNLEHAKFVLNDRADIADDSHDHPAHISFMMNFPPQMQTINVSGSIYLTGGLASTVTLNHATHVRSINMSYIHIIGCTTRFHGIENFEVFNISGNDCYNTSLTLLNSFPRLKALSMQKMTFTPGFVAHNGRRFFHNVTRLETLNLAYNDLGSLPPDLLSRQPALQELFLNGNNLESLDLDLSYHLNLRVLDLSDNRLLALSEAARDSLDRLAAKQHHPFHLRLHGNPLACTCAMLDFLRWLGATPVVLDKGDNLTCVTDSGRLSSTGVESRKWMAKWRRCVGPTALWSAMALLLLMTSLTGKLLHYWPLNFFFKDVSC